MKGSERGEYDDKAVKTSCETRLCLGCAQRQDLHRSKVGNEIASSLVQRMVEKGGEGKGNMVVMNFGAGNENPYEPAVIPNDAITSPDGFIGAGMPPLWLLSANEGLGYPLRVVNFLWNYAHRRDVYAAVIVPGDIEGYQDANRDGQPDDVNDDGVIDDRDLVVDVDAYGFTYGPIWDEAGGPIAPPGDWGYIPQFWGPPVIEVDVDLIRQHQQNPQQNPNGLTELQALTWVVGHELGHTVLWHHPGYGHHAGNTTFDCLIWQWIDWRPNPPTEFCVVNPGCQTRWKLNP